MDSREGRFLGFTPPKTSLKSLWTAFVVPTPPSRKTFLFIMAGALFPLILLLILSYREVDRHLTQHTYERREALAQLAETSVRERLDRFVAISESLASRPGVLSAVGSGDWYGAVDIYLMGSLDYFPEIDRLFLVNSEGVLMADWPRVLRVQGESFASRDWFQGVSAKQSSYVSEIYRRKAEPSVNVIAIASPLFELTPEKKVLGYLVIQVKADTFLAWSSEIDAGPGSSIFIVDQYGQIVSHPKYDPQGEILDYSSLEPIQRIKSGLNGEEIFYNSLEQTEQLIAYEPVHTYGWGVVVAQSTDSAFVGRDEVLRDLLVSYSILFFMGSFFAFMALWLFARMRSYAFTTAQRMNQSLSERQAQLNEAEELAKLGSWKWDLKKKTVSCSDELYRLTGASRTEFSDPMTACMSLAVDRDKPRVKRAYSRTFKKGKAIEDFQIQRKSDQKIRWLRLRTKATVDSAGEVVEVAGVVQDITLEKELEESKSEFVTLAAHQLRTPLSIINWTAELLLEDKKDPLTQKQRTNVEDIWLTNKRLVKLVNTLLNISRIEMGTFLLRHEEVSAAQVSKRVLQEYQPQLKKRGIKVKTTFAEGLEKFFGDENLVFIILSNLISNSISYSPDKSKISIYFFKKDGQLHIEVKDTGFGIPQHAQEKIFNKFFRAENAKKIKPEGTGLGLFMVRSLVEDVAKGKIWFKSTEGKGTEFYVTLPLYEPGKKKK